MAHFGFSSAEREKKLAARYGTKTEGNMLHYIRYYDIPRKCKGLSALVLAGSLTSSQVALGRKEGKGKGPSHLVSYVVISYHKWSWGQTLVNFRHDDVISIHPQAAHTCAYL